MKSKSFTNKLIDFLGLEFSHVSHAERFASVIGGFAGILGIILVSSHFLPGPDALLIVASMGASAVLLFAVPHGKLSQPWALFGGHLVSAFVGVSCAKLISEPALAAALAVSISIGAMHYLRCIHPPGGATALFAVISGEAVHNLGYMYLLSPVLLNVLVIFLVAVLVNAFFPWRRYPASLSASIEPGSHGQAGSTDFSTVTSEDLGYAMSKLNLVLDISEDDLMQLYALASRYSQNRSMDLSELKKGHYYSNGLYGKEWGVRLILDESEPDAKSTGMVIYKTIAGPERRTTNSCTREEFARWARYEVTRIENAWYRNDGEKDQA